MKNERKAFSVRWGADISTIVIEIHDFEMVAKPKLRTSLHRSVESHIQRGKQFIENLKGGNHDSSKRQA